MIQTNDGEQEHASRPNLPGDLSRFVEQSAQVARQEAEFLELPGREILQHRSRMEGKGRGFGAGGDGAQESLLSGKVTHPNALGMESPLPARDGRAGRRGLVG